MVLSCANPGCAAPFNFRQGRLFRFHQNHSQGNAASVNPYSLKHLWLCKQCAEIYTLEYREGRELLIPLTVSRKPSVRAVRRISKAPRRMVSRDSSHKLALRVLTRAAELSEES
jgi:hypothetical protein